MFQHISIQETLLGGIPSLFMHPESEGEHPAILLYHGWSSHRMNQRFLGSILAAQGFAVIAPDAPGHGLRSSIDFSSPESVRRYFWEVVLAAVDEAPGLVGAIQKMEHVDGQRLGVMGISMGSFIGSAVFTDHQQFKAGVCFIGTGSWLDAARTWDPAGNHPTAEQMEMIAQRNPAARPEAIDERPLLLLHGDLDPVVSVDLQRRYYDILSISPGGSRVKLLETTGLGHFLELDMIETASNWMLKNL
jgi:hypothetical protein